MFFPYSAHHGPLILQCRALPFFTNIHFQCYFFDQIIDLLEAYVLHRLLKLLPHCRKLDKY
jgi:hypothetical protein